jgi:hypothetical protein
VAILCGAQLRVNRLVDRVAQWPTMSDEPEPSARRRPARPGSWWPVWAILEGLAVGVASVAAAVAVAFAIVDFAPADTSPCDSDLACLPDLGPLILAVSSIPVVIAAVGPLVARLFALPWPWLFAVPAAWAVVVACVGLGPADGQSRWPFHGALTSLVILLVQYSLIALWTRWQRTKAQQLAA